MESRDTYELRREYPEYVAAMERNYRWNLAALVTDQSFFGLSLTLLSYSTVLPAFVRHLSDRNILVGLISSVYSAGYFAAQLPGAFLVHGRRRRKPAIVWIAVLERVSVVVLALTVGLVGRLATPWVLALFFLAMAIKSVSEGLISPAYSDFVSKSIAVRRGRFYAITSVVAGGVSLAGSYAMKVILDGKPFPGNFLDLFWLGLVVSFASLAAITCYREEPFPEAPERTRFWDFFKEAPKALREQRDFRRLIAIRGILGLGMLATPFFTVYAMDTFALGSGAVGEFTLIMTAVGMLAAVASGWLGDNKGYRSVLLVGAFTGALAPLLMVLVPEKVTAYVVFPLLTIAGTAVAQAVTNLTMELSPPEETARFVGIANTVLAPVVTVGPLLAGWMVDGLSYNALFVTTAVLSVVGLLMVYFSVSEPRLERAG